MSRIARALGRTHRGDAGFLNAPARRTDHLFQERFAPAAMDEVHLLAALREKGTLPFLLP